MQVAPPEGRMSDKPTPVRLEQLILRCYARRTGSDRNRWVAHCIDLDLWASGGSVDAAKDSLQNAIVAYLETVLDTDEHGSIPSLLERRAPLRYRALWHVIRLASAILKNGGPPLSSQSFEAPIPFRLAPI